MAEYLTSSQAADLIQVKKTTLRQWVFRGVDIPFVRFSKRSVRFPKRDLEKWIFDRTQNKKFKNFEK